MRCLSIYKAVSSAQSVTNRRTAVCVRQFASRSPRRNETLRGSVARLRTADDAIYPASDSGHNGDDHPRGIRAIAFA
jgi:hypothetical protein